MRVPPPDGNAPDRPFGRIVGQAHATVLQKARERGPALEQVVDRLRGLRLGRQLRPVLAQPRLQRGHQRPQALGPHRPPALSRHAVDRALDRKQGIDAPHRLNRDRGLLQLRHLEELTTRMRPTRRFHDVAGRATGRIELPEAREGIRLQDPGVARQKGLRVLTPAIRRIEVAAAGGSVPPNGLSSRTTVHSRPVRVLPLASTGTGVSSAWRRAAAST
jgi:hypothetical protein